ncbi:hypothetical protein PUN28_003293 [Cardiocondyla obscurior]|uniref:Uncharacterized protein n=1 Tax=Cardiocondyla obscurior TaxID=286306 RepID=A0AAW2GMK5_9HYME
MYSFPRVKNNSCSFSAFGSYTCRKYGESITVIIARIPKTNDRGRRWGKIFAKDNGGQTSLSRLPDGNVTTFPSARTPAADGRSDYANFECEPEAHPRTDSNQTDANRSGAPFLSILAYARLVEAWRTGVSPSSFASGRLPGSLPPCFTAETFHSTCLSCAPFVFRIYRYRNFKVIARERYDNSSGNADNFNSKRVSTIWHERLAIYREFYPLNVLTSANFYWECRLKSSEIFSSLLERDLTRLESVTPRESPLLSHKWAPCNTYVRIYSIGESIGAPEADRCAKFLRARIRDICKRERVRRRSVTRRSETLNLP